MVIGAFNLHKLTWVDCEPSIETDYSCRAVYDSCVDIFDDYNLVQIVTEPTRHGNALELIVTSNAKGVSKV